MNDTVIKVEGISKLYRLGEVGTGGVRRSETRVLQVGLDEVGALQVGVADVGVLHHRLAEVCAGGLGTVEV